MDIQIKQTPLKVPLFGSTRLSIYILLYVATLLNYTVHFAINMSIVCMVVPNQHVNLTHSMDNITTQDFISNNTIDSTCGNDLEAPTDFGYKREFYWSRKQVGYILAGYFYGYIPMQLVGGWMSDKFGIRVVLGNTMLIGGLLSLLTPVAARLHYGALIALRVLIGFSMGAIFNCLQSCIGKWVPDSEKGTYIGIVFSGPSSGLILSFVLSGFLCRYSWTYVFYIFGVLVVLWYVVFMFVVYPSPEDHPRISDKEKAYLTRSKNKGYKKPTQIPYKHLLCNKHNWGLYVNQFCFIWILYAQNIGIPLYMQDVLQFNIKSNGVLSAIPSILQTAIGPFFGIGLDLIYRNLIKDRLTLRRTCQSIFCWGIIVTFLTVSFLDCTQRNQAVFVFCLAYLFQQFIRGGSSCSPSDMAPQMAGSLFGVSNFVGNFASFLVPITIGNLTPTGSQAEWQKIFYISCSIMFIGWLSFMFFVRADEQPWAREEHRVDVVETEVVIEPLTATQDDSTNTWENGSPETLEKASLQKGPNKSV